MKHRFDDSQLLDHPTVRRAYTVMRGFFSKGDDYARQAVKMGENITRLAAAPDPDAVAAAVLQGGMIIPYRAESFKDSVSEGAAKLLRNLRKLSTRNPQLPTEADRQFMLALCIEGLENIKDKVETGEFWSYKDARKMVETNERTIAAAAAKGPEDALLLHAQEKLLQASEALENRARRLEAQASFESSGLPPHPTLKKAYALIATREKKRDRFAVGYRTLGLGIAKVLFETGTTDPDMLGAAILNQHYLAAGFKGKESDLFENQARWEQQHKEATEAGLAKMRAQFSERLIEIYRETSPFSDIREINPPVISEERAMISGATYVYLLEEAQKTYLEKQKARAGDFKSYTGPLLLEQIEDYAKIVGRQAGVMADAGLKARMEQAVTSANALIHAPANVRLRKPGSPSLRGW